ncbi:MAG: phosphoesterase [Clostridiales bacterium]|jgi:predicted metal-dependent phosphoesterase TrpH|nr:phosphoesterase [Clostridiales bacterium]
MKLYYDMHMHSALSPCGNNEMTPNNIVNMAALNELDCIALTDHNTAGNVRAAVEAARVNELDLIVIPGVEAETSEEIHMVCLFPEVAAAEDFSCFLNQKIRKIKNKPDIFGKQFFMNESDEIIGEEENLLIVATEIDIYQMITEVKSRDGVIYPAHIDRNSSSVLANLGFIPPDLDINIVEVSRYQDPVKFLFDNKKIVGRKFCSVQSSDAHRLEDIFEKNLFIDFEGEKSAGGVIKYLKELKYK